MRLTLSGYLLLALLLSTAGNGFLVWRLAGSVERCKGQMVSAALKAIENERDRANKADKEAADITKDTKADTREDVTGAQGKTNDRDQAFRGVPTFGDCRMPAGLQSLQPAIDEANAAASD